MLFTPIKKFQQGGLVAPTEEPMPTEEVPVEGAPTEGQDPMMMLAEAAALALQTQDCQIALQVCQGLIGLTQLMSGAASLEPQGEPVFKKGGVLLRRIKK